MKWLLATALLASMTLGLQSSAGAKEELSEQEMSAITAGGVSAGMVDGVLQFQFDAAARSGLRVEGSGSVAQLGEPLAGGQGSSLVIGDNAQSNLSSFITVNAVNSAVNLLVNLNININSVIGNVGQTNTGGGL